MSRWGQQIFPQYPLYLTGNPLSKFADAQYLKHHMGYWDIDLDKIPEVFWQMFADDNQVKEFPINRFMQETNTYPPLWNLHKFSNPQEKMFFISVNLDRIIQWVKDPTSVPRGEDPVPLYDPTQHSQADENTSSKELIKTLFRVWTGDEERDLPGEVIALFPERPPFISSSHEMCLGYTHQLESIDMEVRFVMKHSRKAEPYEYEDLLEELKKTYYCDFVIVQKVTKAMHEKRIAELEQNRRVCIRWTHNYLPLNSYIRS
ncbi:MAG: hypothetical protein LDL41_22735 [Coleofasciculus sp. S288]|nr:hypothetical protein [Coleofasciculus sp. S288]